MSSLLSAAAGNERPALVDVASGRVVTYQQLEQATARSAGALRHLAGRLSFIYATNDLASVLAYVALVEAGSAVALMDPATAADDRARLEKDYEPDLVIGAEPADVAAYETVDVTSFGGWQRN